MDRAEQSILDAVHTAGQRGLTVSAHSVRLASALIRALPSHVPIPAIVVEDDGQIALDWDERSDQVLSISTSDTGQLWYAGLVGLESDYGRAPFAGSIPEAILFNLPRLHPAPTQARRR